MVEPRFPPVPFSTEPLFPAEPSIHRQIQIITWPLSGGVGLLPAGRHTFDLFAGELQTADGQVELLSGKLDVDNWMQSVHFHPYFSSGMAVEIEPPRQLLGQKALPFWIDRTHHFIHHVSIQKLHVWMMLPGALFVEFGEEHEAPVLPEGFFSPDVYIADLTTADAYAAAVMRPAAPNAITKTVTAMTEARAQTGEPLLDAQCVQTLFSRHQTWIVRNTGANSADINLQGAMRAAAAFFVDDPGVPGGIYVLASGDSVVLQVTRTYNFTRLRARSSVAGASTTLTIDFSQIGGI